MSRGRVSFLHAESKLPVWRLWPCSTLWTLVSLFRRNSNVIKNIFLRKPVCPSSKEMAVRTVNVQWVGEFHLKKLFALCCDAFKWITLSKLGARRAATSSTAKKPLCFLLSPYHEQFYQQQSTENPDRLSLSCDFLYVSLPLSCGVAPISECEKFSGNALLSCSDKTVMLLLNSSENKRVVTESV